MKIFITKNLSKNLPELHAQFDAYGRLVQDEFKRLANAILEGIPCYINEQRIETDIAGMAKFGYEIVTCDASALPARILNILQEGTKLTGSFSQALYSYNQSVKQKVERYIKHRSKFIQDLDNRNRAYEDIMTAAIKQGITAYSPCQRTQYEVDAKLKFIASLPTDDDITNEQIEFVKRNASKFGLDIPELKYYYASREARQYQYDDDGNPVGHWDLKEGHNWSELNEGRSIEQIARFNHHYKSHGYTEEIQRVYHSRENYFNDKVEKDWKQAFHPDNMPEDFMVINEEATRAMYKEVYKQLMWFMSLPRNLQDEFIAEGYTRCPHCGQIARIVTEDITSTCELCDGLIEDVDGLDLSNGSNDMLFYGTDISDSYSDLNEVRSFVGNTEED